VLSAPGSLTVNLLPAAAVAAGATWRVDGGSWRTGGATVSGLVSGNHSVEYSALSGWVAPDSDTLAIANGQTLVVSRTYIQNAVPPTITIPPQSLEVTVGDTATFNVVAAGTAPFSYQWRMDGQPLVGELSPQLSIPQANLNLSGAALTVVVSNKAGSVTSQPPAILTVVASTARATSFLPASFIPGSAFSVTVRVTPDNSVSRYYLQDQPPTGWTVSNIGQGGILVAGQVQWPEFNDATARTFSYTVTPPANASGTATFSGSVILNGNKPVAITGARNIQASPILDAPRLVMSVQRAPIFQAGVYLYGTPGKTYTLEVIRDLGASGGQILTATNLTLNSSSVFWPDANAYNQPRRFYRAKLVP